MVFFVAVQNTYNDIEMALFNGATLLDTASIPKAQASSLILPTLDELLKRNKTALTELSFLAVNQGPGPFTTLRVVIASVNGISFANQIPLVGVDALHAFLNEYNDINYSYTVALLNAFNNDVYFGISNNGSIRTGCMNNMALLHELREQFPHQQIRFIGNGAQMYHHDIYVVLGSNSFIPDSVPQTCSINQIGLMGLELWNDKQSISKQLLPLYLKQFKPHSS